MSRAIEVVTICMLTAQAVVVLLWAWSRRRRPKQAVNHDHEVISIKKLMATGGFENERDLIDDALNFYEHMTEQAMKGNLVGYMDRDRQFTQVLTQGMRWAKDVGRVTGAGEAT